MAKKRKALETGKEEAPAGSLPPLKKKKKGLDGLPTATSVATPASEGQAPVQKKKKKKKPADSAPATQDSGQLAQDPLGLDAPSQKKKGTAPTPGGGGPPAAAGKPDVNCTVFVDGVPYVWNLEKIQEFFKDCGAIVEVRAPTWQDSGRLRGFAHITFKTVAGKKKALAMNGTKVGKKARYLKIEPAKSVEAAPAAPPLDLEGKKRLFVKNLPYDAQEAEIAKLFATCGKVREVRVPTSFGRAKGFAYVEFAQPSSLKAAFELQPAPQLRGRALRLDADGGIGPRAGFHYRAEAYESGFGPKKKRRPSNAATAGQQRDKRPSLF